MCACVYLEGKRKKTGKGRGASDNQLAGGYRQALNTDGGLWNLSWGNLVDETFNRG